MSLQDDNKAIVGRWFTGFWGETCDLRVVDEIAAPDMLLKEDGRITEEIGLDDGVTALDQLGLLRTVQRSFPASVGA